MGTVYPKGTKLYLGFKIPDGTWKYQPSGFDVGEEADAHKLLKKIEEQVRAGVEIVGKTTGPVTVREFAKSWIARRKALVADWANDQGRLRDHILETPISGTPLGDMAIDEVRPRHIIALVDRMRAKKLAPKTVYNIYSAGRCFATRCSRISRARPPAS